MATWRSYDFVCPVCKTQEARTIDITVENALTIERCGEMRYDARIEQYTGGIERLVVELEPDTLHPHVYQVGTGTDGQPLYCCTAFLERRITAAPPVTINKKNSDYNERERERLEARSNHHFQTKGKDEKMDRIKMMETKLKKQAGL